MGMLSRRDFLLAAGGAFGGLVLPSNAFGEGGQRLLRFGVLSDVHIFPRQWPEEKDRLIKALHWLDNQGVEAVMFPGDQAHSGLISELKVFADAWFSVFPNFRGKDGRHVEMLLVTGNHDADGWGGRWKGFDEARLRSERLNYGDNLKKSWDRFFQLPFASVSMRTINGVPFVGAEWRSLNPDVCGFMAAHRSEIDPSQPFFFFQHLLPRNAMDWSKGADDDVGRALDVFPTAVAISGHTHRSLMDERSLRQGTFTSIDAGCLRETPTDFYADCINGGRGKDRLMRRMSETYDCEKQRFVKVREPGEGGCGMLVDVYRDHLVCHRRNFAVDGDLGDWAVPLPASLDGPVRWKVRQNRHLPPRFPETAVVSAEYVKSETEVSGPALYGKPCVKVTFTGANPEVGRRAFFYDVAVMCENAVRTRHRIVAPDFNLPVEKAGRAGVCLFAPSELPNSGTVDLSVTALDVFGNAGMTIKGRFNYADCRKGGA